MFYYIHDLLYACRGDRPSKYIASLNEETRPPIPSSMSKGASLAINVKKH